MATVKYKNYTITYKATAKNIHVVNSYRITKKADMNAIVKLLRAGALKSGFSYKRSNSSWVTEWRAHNYMYNKKIERDRTASVDLNENESKLKLLSYSLMSLLYRG